MCFAVLVVLSTASCSAPGLTTERGADDTDFSGPWAEDFRAAYQESESEYERSVIRDGMVTADELEDAHSRIDRCLRDSDLTVEYDPDGGFEIASTVGEAPSNDMSRTNRVLEACEARYDQRITMLFQQTRRNPEKLDDAKITVTCLRESGLVGPDYSTRQFREDYDSYEFPFDTLDEQWRQCDLDPLGLWRTP